MRKADLRLILRRRNLACDHHAVEGGSEAFAAASWSGDVSRPALKRAHEHDYTVHDYNEAKRGRRFGRRQALHLYSEYNDEANIFISCLCCGSFICSAVHFVGEHGLSVRFRLRHFHYFSSSIAEAAVYTRTSPTLGRSCVS